MKDQTRDREPLGRILSQLFGYIYCMLVSNSLLGMPLFGGALFLCARAVVVYLSVYRRRNRLLLPAYTRKWGILLLAVLLLLVILLTGLYPSRMDSPKVWIMMALIGLGMAVDLLLGTLSRLVRRGERSSVRLGVLIILALLFFTGLATWMLIVNTDLATGISLSIGFLLRTMLQGYSAAPGRESASREPEQMSPVTQSLKAYRTFQWMGLLLIMAVEMTLSVIYALLAVRTEELAGAMLVGIGCAVLAAELSAFFLRRGERKNNWAPTALLCVGLMIWAYGVLLCGQLLQSAQFAVWTVYLCIAISSAGGMLSMAGLRRVDSLMPQILRISGQEISPSYDRIRQINWDFSVLLGDVLALIFLTIFFFATGMDLPRDMNALSERFQPVMLFPLALVVIGALLSVIRFPLSARQLDRVRRFLRLEQTGEENDALRRRLEQVASDQYGLPIVSDLIIFVLRRMYRHTLVHPENMKPDDLNPYVFICNHGEFYGPIVCELFLPVHVRPWTISRMMYDKKKVSAYIYENTIKPVEWMPMFLKRILARFTGWLSVTVMREMEAIPVYRESPMKLRETFRLSVEALEAGDHLLIFPENPEYKYASEGINPLSPGFVMVGTAYYRKTGKRLRFMPLYANKIQRTITFGQEIVFDPEKPYAEEQDRIVQEAEQQIRQMAGVKENPE